MVITIGSVVGFIVTLIVIAAIVYLLFKLIDIVPMPDPYKKWIRIVLEVLVILVLINMLLGLIGYPIVRFR